MRSAAGPLTTFEKVNLALAMTWQHAALTLGLWTIYLAGAVCGGFSIQRWALLGMLAPFGLITAISLYGAFRRLLPLSGEEW